MKTFVHDQFKHRYLVEQIHDHWGGGNRFSVTQLDQTNCIVRSEELTEVEFNKFNTFLEQGQWKQLLVE